MKKSICYCLYLKGQGINFMSHTRRNNINHMSASVEPIVRIGDAFFACEYRFVSWMQNFSAGIFENAMMLVYRFHKSSQFWCCLFVFRATECRFQDSEWHYLAQIVHPASNKKRAAHDKSCSTLVYDS